ncbi:MAG: hypothetical protein AAF368_02310, partial [Planctomycetota bacterium]
MDSQGPVPTDAPTLFDDIDVPAKKKTAAKKKVAKKTATSSSRTAKKTAQAEPAPKKKSTRKSADADSMAKRQREISVSEFFTKNRHLLGFDSPLKGLLTAVKEAVDNSLDACEEAGILPEITVELISRDLNDGYRSDSCDVVTVFDRPARLP